MRHDNSQRLEKPSQAPNKLDARVWSGPWCLLKIINRLVNMERGAHLEVWVDDPVAVAALPRLLKANDHKLISTQDRGDFQSFYIQRRQED